MSSFVGRSVRIQTQDYTVEGLVITIENGILVLKNATSIATGEYLPKMIVEGSDITNVELCDGKAESPSVKPKDVSEARESSGSPKIPNKPKKKHGPGGKTREDVACAPKEEPISRDQDIDTQKKFPKGVVKLASKFPSGQEGSRPGSPLPCPRPQNHGRDQQRREKKPQKEDQSANSPNVQVNSSFRGKEISSPTYNGSSLVASNGQGVPIATPLQLSQIIGQMRSLGFNPAGISERAAEGLCEAMGPPQGIVVLLVGTHMVGHWAIAAGRRLALRGYSVVAVSPAADAAVQLSSESKSFVAAGGHFVTTQKALFSILGDQKPPAVVIDALGGFETPLVDQLDENEYAAATWLVNWSAHATKRISLCLPLLQDTIVVGFGFPLGPSTYVVDIGVPQKALVALKLKRFIEFRPGTPVLSI